MFLKLIGMGENNLEIVGGRIEFNCVDNYHTYQLLTKHLRLVV